MAREDVMTTDVTEESRLLGTTQPLVGVVSRPTAPCAPERPAVLLSNSGFVHRVGPAGIYVRIARSLAASGHLAARIDHAGIGDSSARADHRPYPESAVDEMREVMDDLSTAYGVERFVILGLGSGAEIALHTARTDARVRGVVMINGGGEIVRGEHNRRVVSRLAGNDEKPSAFQPGAWWRAFVRRIQYWHLAAVIGRRVKGLRGGGATAAASFVEDVHALVDRDVRLLWVCSEGDHAVRMQKVMRGPHLDAIQASGRCEVEVIPDSDHAFRFLRNQRTLMSVVDAWANRSFR